MYFKLLLLHLFFDIIYMIGKRDNMNKKGQALVEFVLILPVLLLILMAMIDIGNIFLTKYTLNNDLDTVTNLYQNNDLKKLGTYLANENLTLDDKTEDGMTTLTIKKNIEINAPILSNVLGENYEVTSSKVIYLDLGGISGE